MNGMWVERTMLKKNMQCNVMKTEEGLVVRFLT